MSIPTSAWFTKAGSSLSSRHDHSNKLQFLLLQIASIRRQARVVKNEIEQHGKRRADKSASHGEDMIARKDKLHELWQHTNKFLNTENNLTIIKDHCSRASLIDGELNVSLKEENKLPRPQIKSDGMLCREISHSIQLMHVRADTRPTKPEPPIQNPDSQTTNTLFEVSVYCGLFVVGFLYIFKLIFPLYHKADNTSCARFDVI